MNEDQPKAGCEGCPVRDKIRRGIVGDLSCLKSDESELDGPSALFHDDARRVSKVSETISAIL